MDTLSYQAVTGIALPRQQKPRPGARLMPGHGMAPVLYLPLNKGGGSVARDLASGGRRTLAIADPAQLRSVIQCQTTRSAAFQADTVANSGPALRWNMGDGTVYSANRPSHTYADGSRKTIEIEAFDGWAGLTDLRMFALNLTGTIDAVAHLTNLTVLVLHTNQFTGTIDAVANLTNLTILYLHINQFTGTIDAVANLTNLTILYLYSNQFTGYSSGTFEDQRILGDCQIRNNQLTQAAVDNILADFVTNQAARTAFETTHRSRTSNVATLRLNANHGYQRYARVKISGVGGTGYNGENIYLSGASDTSTADRIRYANTGSNESETADTGGRVIAICQLDLSGTNSPPSAAGLLNRDTLVAAGWTVTVAA